MSRVKFFEHSAPPPTAAPPSPPTELDTCCECGEFGCYGDGQDFYCSKHAPIHLKQPAVYAADGSVYADEGDDYGI